MGKKEIENAIEQKEGNRERQIVKEKMLFMPERVVRPIRKERGRRERHRKKLKNYREKERQRGRETERKRDREKERQRQRQRKRQIVKEKMLFVPERVVYKAVERRDDNKTEREWKSYREGAKKLGRERERNRDRERDKGERDKMMFVPQKAV